MTIKELINEIKQLPEDMEVVVQYRDYGGEYDDELLLMIKNGILYL